MFLITKILNYSPKNGIFSILREKFLFCFVFITFGLKLEIYYVLKKEARI